MNLVFKNTDTRRCESRSCWWSSMIGERTAGRVKSSCVCQGPWPTNALPMSPWMEILHVLL